MSKSNFHPQIGFSLTRAMFAWGIVTSKRCVQWSHFIGLKESICTTPDNIIDPDNEGSK